MVTKTHLISIHKASPPVLCQENVYRVVSLPLPSIHILITNFGGKSECKKKKKSLKGEVHHQELIGLVFFSGN